MDPYIGKFLDDRYEILDVLGTGGMAVVYRAYCHRLNRYVAVKILKRELASDQDLRRRFHDESQAVAMLSHPNIVAVYDVSQVDNCEFIVMELIEGITLKQYMQKRGGSLNWREALHFITQIMQGLKHAHSRGIIHRDIKPQNVMVLRDGSVKVTDFGIARSTTSQATVTQEAIGSVHYISPEQARGSHIDARSDLYSAGVVLYEMLTGRLPYEGDNPVAVALQHINSIPVSPRELNPDIPLGIEQITLKAMASVADRRYANAEAMLMDLEDFRKNPEIDFGYGTLGGVAPLVDEPTMIRRGNPGFVEDGGDSDATVRDISGHRVPARFEHERQEMDDYEEDYDDDLPREKKSNRTFVAVTVTLVVILIGILAVLYFTVFRNMFASPEGYEVPDLVGQTVEEVEERFNGNEELKDHFTVTVTAYEASDEEAGVIIDQSPKGGRISKQETTEISVTVSSGPATVEPVDIAIEDYANEPYAKVKGELEELLLKTIGIPEASDTVEKDHVIRTEPTVGSTVHEGDTVTIYYSTGSAEPEDTTVKITSLMGLTERDARNTLAALGLETGDVSTEYNDNYPSGQVCYQSYPDGTTLEKGTKVDFVVSLGPEPATVPQEPVTPEGPNQGDSSSGGEPASQETKWQIEVELPENRETSSEVVITLNGTVLGSATVPVDQSTYAVEYTGALSSLSGLSATIDGAPCDYFINQIS